MATRTLIWLGLLGPLVFHGLGAVAAATWPGYDPVARSISSLVHAPLGWLQTVAFASGVPLSLGWAIGAGRVIGASPRDRATVRLVFLVQVAIALAFTLLPTDAPGAPRTLVGQLHLLTFFAYAIATPFSIVLCARVFRRDPRWLAAARPSLIAALLMLVATLLVPLTLDGPLTPWLGLTERAYVAIPGAWQAAVALRALRLPPGDARSST